MQIPQCSTGGQISCDTVIYHSAMEHWRSACFRQWSTDGKCWIECSDPTFCSLCSRARSAALPPSSLIHLAQHFHQFDWIASLIELLRLSYNASRSKLDGPGEPRPTVFGSMPRSKPEQRKIFKDKWTATPTSFKENRLWTRTACVREFLHLAWVLFRFCVFFFFFSLSPFFKHWRKEQTPTSINLDWVYQYFQVYGKGRGSNKLLHIAISPTQGQN